MEFLENLKENGAKAYKFLSKIAVILISLVVGFLSSELHREFTERAVKPVPHVPKTLTRQETSVAINERGEIIFMNRADGTYVIYSDSVGQMVFNHYASSMYFKATGSTLQK